MTFKIDEQTLQDLEVNPVIHSEKSVFDYYNVVKTIKGRKRLLEMLNAPTNSKSLIQRRVESLRFFIDNNLSFDITNRQIDFIETYMDSNILILKNTFVDSTIQKIKNKLTDPEDYYILSSGIKNILYTFRSLFHFSNSIKSLDPPSYLNELIDQLLAFCAKKPLSTNLQEVDILKKTDKIKLNEEHIFEYDGIFRKQLKDELKSAIDIISEIDVLMGLAEVARNRNLCLPNFTESAVFKLEINEFYHPFLKNPIKNNFSLQEKNVCFLSGPNMAGKSTFLKSLSLCIYLAHIGFPIPAKSIELSVFNGMMTSINLSDNVNKGYSHFLSEVKRVKKATEWVLENDKFFVVFDELFKGTNVKDAYEASTLIIKSLSKIKNSFFIISTHLIEIVNEIQSCSNISYKQLEVELEGSNPIYTFKVNNGVSSKRLGMLIVQNEGILEILEKINSQ